MRAICLSAGRSSRLMPLTRNVHKSALRVRGWSILDWQMTAFLRADIDEVVVVVGHGSEETYRLLDAWKDLISIDLVNNPEFDRKNLDFSLFCAERYLRAPFLYFEGDLLLAPELLTRLSRANSEIAIATSRIQRAQRADAVVRLERTRPYIDCAEHGSLDVSNSEGEFVCAVRLGSHAASALKIHLSSCDFTGPMQVYRILSKLMRSEPTEIVDASNSPWIEIDSQKDLECATAIVDAFGCRPPLSRREAV
jgi:choline kinase